MLERRTLGKVTGLETGDVEDADEVDLLHRWVLTTNPDVGKTDQTRI